MTAKESCLNQLTALYTVSQPPRGRENTTDNKCADMKPII